MEYCQAGSCKQERSRMVEAHQAGDDRWPRWFAELALSDDLLLPALCPDEWLARLESLYRELRYQIDTRAYCRGSGTRPSVRLKVAR